MEPIIIYVEKSEGNELTMDRSMLEKYIQQAYEAGYKDGQNANKLTTPWPTNTTPVYNIKEPKVTEQYYDPITKQILTREIPCEA